MLQGQKEPLNHRHLVARSPLLQRYPVLTPVVLLGSSLLLGVVSLFSDTLFPILALVGVSVNTSSTLVLLCLLVASITGIAGVLTSIIGILGYADRRCATTAVSVLTLLKLKEQTYANRH